MKNGYSTEVDQIMNSIEGVGRATPSPYFYAKLMHKMQSQQQSVLQSFLSKFRPVLVIGVLSAMVFVNIVLVMRESNKVNSASSSITSQRSNVQVFSEEYNLNASTDY